MEKMVIEIDVYSATSRISLLRLKESKTKTIPLAVPKKVK